MAIKKAVKKPKLKKLVKAKRVSEVKTLIRYDKW